MNKYKIRHLTLKALVDKHNEVLRANKSNYLIKANLQDILTTELITKIGVSEEDFRAANVKLVRNNEMKYINEAGEENCTISDGTLDAYIERKYLVEKRTAIYDEIYNISKWFVPILMAVVTILIAVININSNNSVKNKLDKNELQLQQLKNKVDSLIKTRK